MTQLLYCLMLLGRLWTSTASVPDHSLFILTFLSHINDKQLSQVLLVGGQVFFLGDLPFLLHLMIYSAQNEWNTCNLKTQIKKEKILMTNLPRHVPLLNQKGIPRSSRYCLARAIICRDFLVNLLPSSLSSWGWVFKNCLVLVWLQGVNREWLTWSRKMWTGAGINSFSSNCSACLIANLKMLLYYLGTSSLKLYDIMIIMTSFLPIMLMPMCQLSTLLQGNGLYLACNPVK